MSLSAPVSRELKHTRRVVCQCYERSDGLWDIEAQLEDTKSYAIPPENGGRPVAAGDPIHHMKVRLTITTDLLITAIEVSMEHTPYPQCANIESAFQSIVGESIGGGWRKMLREKLGGIQGCTHIVELLGPIATTAYQSLYKIIFDKSGMIPLNGCHAWAQDGKLVKEFHPTFYQSTSTTDGDQ